MGTVVFECGCFVSTSMFEDGTVLAACPCAKHAFDTRVQKALAELARVVLMVAKENENGTTD